MVMLLRLLAVMLVLSCFAPADASARAQAAPAPSDGDGQSKPAQTASDAIAGRIKYLHDRLRITAEQEQLWNAVSQAIRDNARDAAPLLKERFRATTNGTALDILNSYEALGQVELESLKKFMAAFDPLYATLADDQKKIADAILRQGPLETMIGGIPEIPTPFSYALAYSWTELGLPLFIHRPRGLVRLHLFGAPGGRLGRFHR